MDYVAESKRMFDRGDYQWKNALGFDLHQRDPKLTALWAILCAECLLSHRFPGRLHDLQNDLSLAKRRLNAFPESGDPKKLEYEIWYRPNRDAPQTAMSKLFTAIREFHQRGNCVWASGAVIANLVADDWTETTGTVTSRELYDIVLLCYFGILNKIESDPDTVG